MFESNALNRILELEIGLGNEIVEDTEWPPKCKKLIILKNRFSQSYSSNSKIEYHELNDPHHWFSEYRTIDVRECLACKNST